MGDRYRHGARRGRGELHLHAHHAAFGDRVGALAEGDLRGVVVGDGDRRLVRRSRAHLRRQGPEGEQDALTLVVVLDVLTKHPPEMLFVDRDDMVETLAPERADDALGDGVGVRRAHRSQNRLDPEPSSACDEVSAIATVAVSDQEPWLLTPGGRLDHLLPDPGRVRMLRDVPVPDAAPVVVDHDEHVERAEGERLDREPVSGPDAGRVVAEKRAPRLARGVAAALAGGSDSRCGR